MHNTADLQDFAIIGFKSLGRSTSSLVAVTGPKAKLVKENGVKMAEQVTQLQKNVDDNIDKVIRELDLFSEHIACFIFSRKF